MEYFAWVGRQDDRPDSPIGLKLMPSGRIGSDVIVMPAIGPKSDPMDNEHVREYMQRLADKVNCPVYRVRMAVVSIEEVIQPRGGDT